MCERIADLVQAEDELATAEMPVRRVLAEVDRIIQTSEDPFSRILAREVQEQVMEGSRQVTASAASPATLDSYAEYASDALTSVTTHTVSVELNVSDIGDFSISFSDGNRKEIDPAVLDRINRPDGRSWLRLPMGIEYTYHLMRKNSEAFVDAVQKELEEELKKTKEHGMRVYTDGPCLEIASPVHRSWRALERWFRITDNAAKRRRMIPWRRKKGGGGAHVNVSMPSDRDFALRFMRNLLTDVANRPYLNWIFNDPSDDHTANCLWDDRTFVHFYDDPTWKNLSGVSMKSYAVRVKESGEAPPPYSNAINTWLFEANTEENRALIEQELPRPEAPMPEEKEKKPMKPGYFELRFFDMPRNRRDLRDLVKFVNSYMEWIWKMTEAGETVERDGRIRSRTRNVKEPSFVAHIRARRAAARMSAFDRQELTGSGDGCNDGPGLPGYDQHFGRAVRQAQEAVETISDAVLGTPTPETRQHVAEQISNDLQLATATTEEATQRIVEAVLPETVSAEREQDGLAGLSEAMDRHIQGCGSGDVPAPPFIPPPGTYTEPTRRSMNIKAFPKNYHFMARTAHREFNALLGKLGLERGNYRRFVERNLHAKMRSPFGKKYFT